MKLAGKILLGFVALIALLFIVSSLKPDSLRVVRSVVIEAPPAAIYPLLADLRRNNEWSPYFKQDPGMAVDIDAELGRVGSRYHWKGDKTGEGTMTVTGVVPNERVDVRVDFIKPMESTGNVVWSIKPQGTASEVTWAMDGESALVHKVMSNFVDMDKMIGSDFQAGLDALKRVVEGK